MYMCTIFVFLAFIVVELGMELSKNHNSLGLDVIQSPNTQDMFRLIPGLISCTGMTGSEGNTHHAHSVLVDSL